MSTNEKVPMGYIAYHVSLISTFQALFRYIILFLREIVIKDPAPLAEYFFRLFAIEIHSAIGNNLKPIGMMQMQCVIIHPNIYECVSDYMKIYHDRFWKFYGHFANVAG